MITELVDEVMICWFCVMMMVMIGRTSDNMIWMISHQVKMIMQLMKLMICDMMNWMMKDRVCNMMLGMKISKRF